MNTIKRIGFVLCIISLFCFAGTISAADETGIAINSVTFEKYMDLNGFANDEYIKVVTSFSVPEGTTQISFLLSSEPLSTINEDNKWMVIHMDQMVDADENVYTCNVEKRRMCSALGCEDVEDINGRTLYVKMSAQGIAQEALLDVTYVEPGSDILFGDVNNDGEVNVGDAILILRYEAGYTDFTIDQIEAGDINRDSRTDIGDAIRILRMDANLISSEN